MATQMIPWSGQLPYLNGVPYGQEATDINRFMTNQAVQPFAANLPGYANMVGQRSENTMSMLNGQIPDDVISQIAQGAAERGVSGGAPQSPNSNAAYLRALGLTSLDLMGQGSKDLSQSIADTPVPELWNPASLFVPTVLGAQEKAAASSGMSKAGGGGSSNIVNKWSGLPWWYGRDKIF